MLSIVQSYFLLFLIYSVAGWLFEVCNGFVRFRKFSNRGFLVGPLCPIYGIGVVFLNILLSWCKNDIILTFFLGILICGSLEYFTSYILEKLFNARWWDYSRMKFNLNGRICLETLVLFGIAAVITLRYTNPFFFSIISKIPNPYMHLLCGFLFAILIADCIVSFNVILSLKNVTRDLKDNTDEISQKVKEILSKKSYFGKRLVEAFPDFKILKQKIKDSIGEKIENGADFIEKQKIKSTSFILSQKNKGKKFIVAQKSKGANFITNQKNKIIKLKNKKEG